MQHDDRPRAPNYTNAALVMGAVNLFWVLMVLWASFGWLTALATGLALDCVIRWWSRS